jgi:dihydroneopterin triphosphate diphosphatase
VTVYKQPRSIQVVIFTDEERQSRYLLLKRIPSQGGFWQSLTGSLEGDETHRQAAVREIKEETGILAIESDLIDLGLTNVFEIAPKWLPKYPPGTIYNEEVCFALKVPEQEVALDAAEHTDYIWVDYETAMGMLFWDSNRRALAGIRKLNQQ